MGGAAFLSQLELQSVLERALRRADIPVSFSNGFHPLPLLSFGRALPVGVESLAEWFALSLHSYWDAPKLAESLTPYLPNGIRILRIEGVDKKSRTLSCIGERFELKTSKNTAQQTISAFEAFMAKESVPIELATKKGSIVCDIRHLVGKWESIDSKDRTLLFETNWQERYLSPLKLVYAILGYGEEKNDTSLRLLKRAQFFAEENRSFASSLPWGDFF